MMLALFAAIYGVAAEFVFRRFSNRARIRAAVNHMLAHIMEFALFVDEPRFILKAQLGLIRSNVQLLKLVAVPCAIMALSFLILYPTMDRRFGDHTSNVLTLPAGAPLPAGVQVETPPVRIPRTREVSWRIRSAPPRSNLFGFHWIVWFCSISLLAAGIAMGFANHLRAPLHARRI